MSEKICIITKIRKAIKLQRKMTSITVIAVKTSRMNINQKKSAINKKNKVFILGDSMVKNIRGWEITRKLENKQNIYTRHFSGSKVNYMNDVKLYIRESNPSQTIFHVGTNDLPLDKYPNSIAKSVVIDNCDVIVSSIISRNDQCICSNFPVLNGRFPFLVDSSRPTFSF